MKKWFLIAIMALCSVSFSFGMDARMKMCVIENIEDCKSKNKCSAKECKKACETVALKICEKARQERDANFKPKHL